MSVSEQVRQLEANLRKLHNNKDRDFANSLVHQYRTKGRLSQLQQVWVDKLLDKALLPPEEAPKPVTESINVGLENLHALFDRAKSHVRSNESWTPRIRIVLTDGRRVEVSPAKSTSKNPGSIYVSVADQYYGKIDREGHLTLGPRGIRIEEIHDRIREVAENPTQAGRLHGHKHTWCMFCGIKLESEDSKYYGYGPICAEKWGLEWGEAKERKIEDRDQQIAETTQSVFSEMKAKWLGGLK